MLTRNLSILALGGVFALGLVGCDKKKDESKDAAAKEDGGDEKKADAEKAEPAKAEEGPSEVSLEQVGLKATAPSGASVKDGIGGGAMVQAPGLVVSVDEAGDATPTTPDAAKEDADMYTPLNWKVEELEDGYIATFENKGGAGTNYWVKAYRKLGDKGYTCETTAIAPEQQANAVEFCKSLAPK